MQRSEGDLAGTSRPPRGQLWHLGRWVSSLPHSAPSAVAAALRRPGAPGQGCIDHTAEGPVIDPSIEVVAPNA